MRYFRTALLAIALSACTPSGDSGDTLDLSSLRGQWVVINYWAIWCKPCIQEIPELNELGRLPGVTVLGVNFDAITGPELDQQLQQLGVEFPTLETDPAASLGVARPMVLPTTFVIDPTGEMRDTLVGPQTLETLAAATEQAIEAGRND